MKPQYASALGADLWNAFHDYLVGIIHEHDLKAVCDLGGGRNPTLDAEIARDLDYTVLDISGEELAATPTTYRTVHADIGDPQFVPTRQYDLVFSRMLAEHVANPEAMHRNIHAMLRPGGYALHFFPTLYALPFIANRLLPEFLASHILDLVAKRDRHRHPKFPAYYRWCRGPTRSQVGRFVRLGYLVREYRAFFGHGYYERFPVLATLHRRSVGWLVQHPQPWLTSYAWVLLQRSG